MKRKEIALLPEKLSSCSVCMLLSEISQAIGAVLLLSAYTQTRLVESCRLPYEIGQALEGLHQAA